MEQKNKIGGKIKSFSKHLTNAEFSFPLAKSPQCTVPLCNVDIGTQVLLDSVTQTHHGDGRNVKTATVLGPSWTWQQDSLKFEACFRFIPPQRMTLATLIAQSVLRQSFVLLLLFLLVTFSPYQWTEVHRPAHFVSRLPLGWSVALQTVDTTLNTQWYARFPLLLYKEPWHDNILLEGYNCVTQSNYTRN